MSSNEVIFLEDNGVYPHGEVTISLNEYRDLLDIQSRASILRMYMVKELEKQLKKQETYGHYTISEAELNACDVSNIMGFYPTYHGFEVREAEALKKKAESEVADD